MPYGYHAPYGIFICFLSCRFINRRNTPIFFAFLPLAYQTHFLPYYQKNTPIFLAFFTFFAIFIPFLIKNDTIFPAFLSLAHCFYVLPFQNSTPLLPASALSPKNETIFFALFRFFLNIYRIRR